VDRLADRALIAALTPTAPYAPTPWHARHTGDDHALAPATRRQPLDDDACPAWSAVMALVTRRWWGRAGRTLGARGLLGPVRVPGDRMACAKLADPVPGDAHGEDPSVSRSVERVRPCLVDGRLIRHRQEVLVEDRGRVRAPAPRQRS
jgi:hypothetical protein